MRASRTRCAAGATPAMQKGLPANFAGQALHRFLEGLSLGTGVPSSCGFKSAPAGRITTDQTIVF